METHNCTIRFARTIEERWCPDSDQLAEIDFEYLRMGTIENRSGIDLSPR
jgi:hypothetical protein